ncbi:diheme cytochrome c [Sulfurimonas sp.]|uniref:diheme cytochrome c n=1 Tax=Sulfurimonas sp. TaxID=2022749 RepID=UPI0035659101
MKTIILTLVVLSTGLLADDDYGHRGYKGVAPVTNQLYIKECASCHFAYQPGLLPERSWVKLMDNLENHFDTDATIEPEDNQKILRYLVNNSADKFTNYKRSRKINNSIRPCETPIAVSDTPYFRKEHRGIRKDLIEQKDVKSISNCKACHTSADRGIYGERYIDIPNYGRWDD